MYCTKCGQENPDNAQVCSACGAVLIRPQTQNPGIKTSGMAIAALVLGVLSIVTCALTAIPAIILGIVSLVRIEKSGGSLTGRGFSIAGIVVPAVSLPLIALFMGIMMPALARTRQAAFRMVCATNLSGIGKAMQIYADDYDGALPRSGGKNSHWANRIPNWQASNRYEAFGISASGMGGTANITSCFYLLVKYAEVTPRSFICKGDAGATEFNPADDGAGDKDLIDLRVLGLIPKSHKSIRSLSPAPSSAGLNSVAPASPLHINDLGVTSAYLTSR